MRVSANAIMHEQPTIIYTKTDEAPALATYSLLPIIAAFTRHSGISVETRDISLAGRIIAAFPDYLTEDFPELVRVLPEVESAEVPVFLAYPEELRHSKRIAAFRDFVLEGVIAYRRQRSETGS